MIDNKAIEIIFTEARTYYAWQSRPVQESLLHKAFDLAKMGATSANCSPMRVIFVQSQAAKQRLKSCLAEANIEKTMSAPVTAILANDLEFYQHLPKLFPHDDAKSWFEGNDELIKETASRNGTLQAAYFMLAARAVGLDCGPMSGFDQDKINEEFLGGTQFKSNFLCNLGYADKSAAPNQHLRSPRFEFTEVCQVL
jgi:3-hydroxypropanoate dehydrogenase